MVFTESAKFLGSRSLASANKESKEAAFTVLVPWGLPCEAIADLESGFLAGGMVFPPQYNIATSINDAAMKV